MSNQPEQTTERPLRVGVLWRYAETSSLYRPWLAAEDPNLEFEVLEDYHVKQLRTDFDVLVTHMHYRWDELAYLKKTLELGTTAVLVIADGILEYRNSWLNPKVPDGSMLRPAFAHKIAAIGCAQARLLESWGNFGKCEVVGLPRLDDLIEKHGWRNSRESPVAESMNSGSTRLLICSATTPAFDSQQWEITLRAFQDLSESIADWNHNKDHKLIPTWRVAEEIFTELNVPPSSDEESLHNAIQQADAVVTTPSTIQLEAMICRKPTILLDYFSTPNYVPAAWNIQQRDHVPAVFEQLVSKDDSGRINYQDFTLRDHLWTYDSASQRMLNLIQAMGKSARRAKVDSTTIDFECPILSLEINQAPMSEAQVSKWLSQSMKQSLSDFAGDRSVWMEDVQTQAAIHRATTASEDRAQLKKVEATMFELQNNYEESLEEKRLQINEQIELLDAAAARHQSLNELLESRNSEIAKVQNRVQELSDARQEDHRMLTEAHADAKAKQIRVNELRDRVQDLLQRIEEMRKKLADSSVTAGANERIKQLDTRLADLLQQNETLRTNNHKLKENNQRLHQNIQPLQERIEELIAERKALYQRLKKYNSTE